MFHTVSFPQKKLALCAFGNATDKVQGNGMLVYIFRYRMGHFKIQYPLIWNKNLQKRTLKTCHLARVFINIHINMFMDTLAPSLIINNDQR
jgi:hypothetical protein